MNQKNRDALRRELSKRAVNLGYVNMENTVLLLDECDRLHVERDEARAIVMELRKAAAQAHITYPDSVFPWLTETEGTRE